MTATTTTTDTTTTTTVASLTLTVEGLQRLLAPALRIVRHAGDDLLRTVEIHVHDRWVLASATDRFRTVVHRRHRRPVQR